MQVPKAKNQYAHDTDVKTKTEAISDMGFTPKQVSRFETLAKNPDIVEQAKAEARENDDIVSRSLVMLSACPFLVVRSLFGYLLPMFFSVDNSTSIARK